MENTIHGGQAGTSAAYDFRLYDQVWQRVSPGMDPFAGPPAGGEGEASAQSGAVRSAEDTGSGAENGVQAVPAPAQEGGVGGLPGAERNPCCMGSEAQESLEVLEGFLQEELAGERCCLALACRTCRQEACRLLRQIAAGKRAAARELCAAYFLITGSRYTSDITVEHMQFGNLAQALRSCYHQEACGSFNYRRASEETMDPCLQKLFGRLGDQAYQRAETVMALLGRMVC